MTGPIIPERCPAIGALLVQGVEVAALRCALDAGHEIFGTPHETVMTWADDAVLQGGDWIDAFDRDEIFDVEIPIVNVPPPPGIWPQIRDRLDDARG